MARRKAPQNKAQKSAPENKDEPARNPEEHSPSVAHDEQQVDDDLLTAYAEKEAQLRRLLKAENNEWVGTLSRQEFRRIADSIRAQVRGEQEVQMEEPEDD